MASKEKDIDSRVEELLDQLQTSTSQAEIELIEEKLRLLRSMQQ